MTGRRGPLTGKKISEKGYVIGNKLGQGGNGSVYEICNESHNWEFPVVIKFFDCNKGKKERERRYQRFCREVETVTKLQESIPGIMKILEYNCPEKIQTDAIEAWYIMEKAETFSVQSLPSLRERLIALIELGKIIEEVHKDGKAHRDIKLDNILVLNNEIKLSDFGLVCSVDKGQHRLTNAGERVGPIAILPPELAEIDLEDVNVDYQKSDVYLYAKVLWMVLTKNTWGFGGEYNRSRSQIYLSHEKYGEGIQTFEPIHKCLEQATKDNYWERISMDECLNYIQQQLDILDGKVYGEEINKLFFCEKRMEMITQKRSDEVVYYDIGEVKKNLIQMIRNLKVCVYQEGMKERGSIIQVDNLEISEGKKLLLQKYSSFDGNVEVEYLCRCTKVICSNKESNSVRFCIEEFNRTEAEKKYISYRQFMQNPFNKHKYIALDEKMVMELII